MKKIVKILIALIMVTSLSACVKKVDESEPIYMYPAFELEKNKRLWGYIDHKGKFVIEPKYDKVHDFTSEGLAKVEKDGLTGVVNSQGKEILSPTYQNISNFENGYFVAFNGKDNQIFDYKGDIQFFGDNKYIHIGQYGDGLFPVALMSEENKLKMGYISKTGNQIIDPIYHKAYGFLDGKAIVQENEEDNFKIINKDNKLVKELDHKDIRPTPNKNIYIFIDDNEEFGLLNHNGEILIDERFESIVNLDDEYIIVGEKKDNKNQYGIINMKGEYLIQPEYDEALLLGEGYFALSNESDLDGGNLYTIVNDKNEPITESKYYMVGGIQGKIRNGLISVYDGESTFAIDLKGNKSDKVPTISGLGEIIYDGKISKANIEGKLAYYNPELLWKETNTYVLREGAVVNEESYVKGNTINIKYPVVEGLENKAAEDIINERLYEEFVKLKDSQKEIDPEDYIYYKSKYSISKVNDLMMIEHVREFLEKDDFEPVFSADIYNINLANGNFYELKDLFKEDSGYIETLTDIVRDMAEERNSSGTGMYEISDWEGVQEDQQFIAQLNTIDIYFRPSEMMSYSEQFPKFRIEQSVIDDILDYNSEFWWTFSVSKGF